ncbi:CCDC90 family protein [Acidobacteria bacterium AH-259-L09]|nr:CCDC90 family protein [Acidobacteria bacterium AH-259-L09]
MTLLYTRADLGEVALTLQISSAVYRVRCRHPEELDELASICLDYRICAISKRPQPCSRPSSPGFGKTASSPWFITTLATKEDLAQLEQRLQLRMDTSLAEMRTEIQAAKVETIRWVLGAALGQVIAVVALVGAVLALAR